MKFKFRRHGHTAIPIVIIHFKLVNMVLLLVLYERGLTQQHQGRAALDSVLHDTVYMMLPNQFHEASFAHWMLELRKCVCFSPSFELVQICGNPKS